MPLQHNNITLQHNIYICLSNYIVFIYIYNITISNKMEQLLDYYFLFLYKIMKRYGMRKYTYI